MSDPFAQDGGLPSVSFGGKDQSTGQITTKPIGYKVRLLVTKAPTLVQSRQYGGTALLFWDPNKKGAKVTEPNDQPCMSVVLHGKVVADSLGVDVGVEKALWAQKPSNLFIEIGNAIKAASLDGGISVGDQIEVELTGFKQGEDQSRAAAKQYKVTVWGANAFAETAPAAAPAGPIPPQPAGPPAPPAGPPAPPPAPVLVDGYDKAAYIATGWTEDAMKAEPKFAAFFAAPAPAGPPAPPAAPAGPPVEDPAAKRAAALAAMSPKDKALLGLA